MINPHGEYIASESNNSASQTPNTTEASVFKGSCLTPKFKKMVKEMDFTFKGKAEAQENQTEMDKNAELNSPFELNAFIFDKENITESSQWLKFVNFAKNAGLILKSDSLNLYTLDNSKIYNAALSIKPSFANLYHNANGHTKYNLAQLVTFAKHAAFVNNEYSKNAYSGEHDRLFKLQNGFICRCIYSQNFSSQQEPISGKIPESHIQSICEFNSTLQTLNEINCNQADRFKHELFGDLGLGCDAGTHERIQIVVKEMKATIKLLDKKQRLQTEESAIETFAKIVECCVSEELHSQILKNLNSSITSGMNDIHMADSFNVIISDINGGVSVKNKNTLPAFKPIKITPQIVEEYIKRVCDNDKDICKVVNEALIFSAMRYAKVPYAVNLLPQIKAYLAPNGVDVISNDFFTFEESYNGHIKVYELKPTNMLISQALKECQAQNGEKSKEEMEFEKKLKDTIIAAVNEISKNETCVKQAFYNNTPEETDNAMLEICNYLKKSSKQKYAFECECECESIETQNASKSNCDFGTDSVSVSTNILNKALLGGFSKKYASNAQLSETNKTKPQKQKLHKFQQKEAKSLINAATKPNKPMLKNHTALASKHIRPYSHEARKTMEGKEAKGFKFPKDEALLSTNKISASFLPNIHNSNKADLVSQKANSAFQSKITLPHLPSIHNSANFEGEPTTKTEQEKIRKTKMTRDVKDGFVGGFPRM